MNASCPYVYNIILYYHLVQLEWKVWIMWCVIALGIAIVLILIWKLWCARRLLSSELNELYWCVVLFLIKIENIIFINLFKCKHRINRFNQVLQARVKTPQAVQEHYKLKILDYSSKSQKKFSSLIKKLSYYNIITFVFF